MSFVCVAAVFAVASCVYLIDFAYKKIVAKRQLIKQNAEKTEEKKKMLNSKHLFC